MTKVFLKKTDDTLEMRITGHAERDRTETGNLCCAAVSMLNATTLNWAANFTESGCGDELGIDNAPGSSSLKVKAHPDHRAELMAMYDYLHIGFELLIDKYPKRIAWGED